MVRPTRWLVVTGVPISASHSQMQSAEKEISAGLFCRQPPFCFLQGTSRVTNAWAIAKVASDGPQTWRILLDVDARFIGNRGRAASAPESGVFRGIFAVQLHGKVRRYDARRWRTSRDIRRSGAPVENPPAVRPFGTLNACKGPADGGRVNNRAGAPGPPTFRIIYREAQ